MAISLLWYEISDVWHWCPKNLIIQFPVFVQPYTQHHLKSYQMETVPVPIIDENEQVQSYMYLKVKKPYVALNSETYITRYLQNRLWIYTVKNYLW